MRTPIRRKITSHQAKFATPQAAYRSGLEEKLAAQIKGAGLRVAFEEYKLPYIRPATSHTYTPDLTLPNGIVIEGKGLLTSEDKAKMRLIKATYPDLDLRFCFSNAQARIAKGSKTTYAMWAERYGFPWSHRDIPPEWFAEKPNRASLACLKEVAGWEPR